MKYFVMFLLMMSPVGAFAHQWTPTYPELRKSYVDKVLVTDLELFNSRNDVSYFVIEVFDEDWKSVQFATTEDIFNVPFLKRKKVSVYIRESDRFKAKYICSRSKILSEGTTKAMVSSRICSKIK